MGISSLVSRAIPIAVGAITGGPIGAASAAVATEAQKKQEKRSCGRMPIRTESTQ